MHFFAIKRLTFFLRNKLCICIRNHILDKGLRLTAQDGTNHDLTKADFQKMIDSDGKEFKICLKLTQQVIDVKGQTCQRV